MTDLKYHTADEHRQRILALVPHLTHQVLPLAKAIGYTLDTDTAAGLDLPPWNNSAMDGFALRAEDTANATKDSPVRLAIIAELPAGTDADPRMGPGQAARIMTGAPIPTDADAIVPLEDVLGWDPGAPTAGTPPPDSVILDNPVEKGRYIRSRGDDLRLGDRVASAGEHLTPHRLSSLAAAGITKVQVRAKPRVAIVSTGSELKAPGEPLRRGQILDSNSLLLANLVDASGGEVVLCDRVSDDPSELESILESTRETVDVVVLTGGASVGAHDVARLVLSPHASGGVQLGESNHSDRALMDTAVRFDRLAMQPGKPQGFGLLPNGRPVWSLPGNPVSAWVSYLLFVEPGLLAMQGRSNPVADWQPVTAVESWDSPPHREQFVPARVVSATGEPLQVVPATDRGSGSHLAGRMARATGLARVAAATTKVSAGDNVLYRSLEN